MILPLINYFVGRDWHILRRNGAELLEALHGQVERHISASRWENNFLRRAFLFEYVFSPLVYHPGHLPQLTASHPQQIKIEENEMCYAHEALTTPRATLISSSFIVRAAVSTTSTTGTVPLHKPLERWFGFFGRNILLKASIPGRKAVHGTLFCRFGFWKEELCQNWRDQIDRLTRILKRHCKT